MRKFFIDLWAHLMGHKARCVCCRGVFATGAHDAAGRFWCLECRTAWIVRQGREP